MKLFDPLEAFALNESGARIIDWASLSSTFAGLAMAVMTTLGTGITGLGDAVMAEPDSPRTRTRNQ